VVCLGVNGVTLTEVSSEETWGQRGLWRQKLAPVRQLLRDPSERPFEGYPPASRRRGLAQDSTVPSGLARRFRDTPGEYVRSWPLTDTGVTLEHRSDCEWSQPGLDVLASAGFGPLSVVV
jgi:hypothetical protein